MKENYERTLLNWTTQIEGRWLQNDESMPKAKYSASRFVHIGIKNVMNEFVPIAGQNTGRIPVA